jgi:hypothetical protein
MRFFEFADTDMGLDKFVTILNNFIGRAASKKQAVKLNWSTVQRIAKRCRFEMDDEDVYGTFKSIYDSKPIIKNLVRNFDADGIELNVPGTDKDTETPVKQGETSQDAVDKMAASAAPQQLAAQA